MHALIHPVVILGALAVVALAARSMLARWALPGVVAYLALGVGLRALVEVGDGVLPAVEPAIATLADVGIVLLLFRVGLDVNPWDLLREVPKSTGVWFSNVALSGALGFVVARYALGHELVPAAFAAVALSATSVAVSLVVWQDAGVATTRLGRKLLVVAELDDLSAVALMAIVFAAAPALVADDSTGGTLGIVLETSGLMLVKALLLGGLCVAFAKRIEPPLSAWLAERESPPDRMVTIASVGLIVAGLAEALGFSLAVGALFAGLMFSQDPDAVRNEGVLEPLLSFLTPFFFISIGFGLSLDSFAAAALPGLLLFVVAVVGKVVGVAAVIAPRRGMPQALLLGVSMVPRAEIATVVAYTGLQLGPSYVPPELYAALVVVAALTCLLTPPLLSQLLERYPPS
jgi:Kef-type K+ transport system membrane component KefB